MDHFVYAVAVHESKTNPPPDHRKLAFPLGDDPPGFEKQRWHIDTLSTRMQAEIKRVQPYKRPHPQLPPLLAMLGDLDDSDKHRLLRVTVAVLQQAEFYNFRGLTPADRLTYAFSRRSIVDGAEIAGFTIDPPKLNVTYNYNLSLAIAITHAAGPSGIPISNLYGLLDFLKTEVSAVINLLGEKLL